MSGKLLRVCLVIDDLRLAGTETQVLALLRHLPAENVEPILVLLNGRGTAPQLRAQASCPVFELGLQSLLSLGGIRGIFRLRQLLVEQRVDVVQLYFRDSNITATLAAQLAGIGTVVRMRTNLGYDFTVVDRVVNTFLLPGQKASLSNCVACRDSLLEQEKRFQGKPAFVVPNGVDAHRQVAPKKRGPRARKVIGCVANLRPVKGLDCLLKAAAIVRDSQAQVLFRIGGEGPQRPQLQQLIVDLGLTECCELMGPVNPWDFAAELDLAISASRTEGMSNAVLEYMASGLPVVATAVGGTCEIIEHEQTGLLVPPDNPQALASAILLLLDKPFYARCLGQAAARKVQKSYTREQMTAGYAAVYRQLVAA